MKLKRITVRIHPLLYEKILEILASSVDLSGFQHMSMNHWINEAIREKISKTNK